MIIMTLLIMHKEHGLIKRGSIDFSHQKIKGAPFPGVLMAPTLITYTNSPLESVQHHPTLILHLSPTQIHLLNLYSTIEEYHTQKSRD